MRLGGEVHDRVDAVDRLGDRRRVLDPRVDERDVEALEVLAPPGVRELVEHDDLVAVLAQAQPHEVRADEAGAAADEELSCASPAWRGTRRRPRCHGGRTSGSRALGAEHAVGGPPRRARELLGRRGPHAAVDPRAVEELERELVPRARPGAGDVVDAGLVRALGELDERAGEVPGPRRAADLVGDDRRPRRAARRARASCRRSSCRPRRTATPCARSRAPRWPPRRRARRRASSRRRRRAGRSRRTRATARAWSRRRRSPSRRGRSRRRPSRPPPRRCRRPCS